VNVPKKECCYGGLIVYAANIDIRKIKMKRSANPQMIIVYLTITVSKKRQISPTEFMK
jgi:mevalonate kinase